MVTTATERGIRVTTNTNLTVLSQKRAGLCVTSGLECIHVSIDAASPEIYGRIRDGSRLGRVLRNLGFLNEARRDASGGLPRLRLVTVIMRQNLAELPELVELAHHWQMESMFVQHLCHDFGEASLPQAYLPMRDFVESQTLLGEDPARIETSFAAARETADRLGLDLRLPRLDGGGFPDDMPGRERCDWPWRGIYVSYQGLVMPCCMISTPDRFNFGSVNDAPAPVIWNGESYEEFRRKLASDEPPEVCRACSVYHGVF
jgi:radical SAM protein with 4Fe4S-binding SPASM domain